MTQAGITRAAGSPVDSPHEPQRSDAQHNRERILGVAREALAASAGASLNSIAKTAGVGPGTLYRHFPSREALVLAVYEDDVTTLAGAAGELLAQHLPLQALRLWFDRLAACGTIQRALADALRFATSDRRTDGAYRQIVGAVTQLLRACGQDGSIRSDVDADDVLLLLGFLWQIAPGPAGAERVVRLLDLTLAGLQAGAPGARADRASRRGGRRSLRSRRRLAFLSLSMPRSQ